MIKPTITLSSSGAKIKSREWNEYNMFNAAILSCWISFLNKQLTHNTK